MRRIAILFLITRANTLVFAKNITTYKKVSDNSLANCATDTPSEIFRVPNLNSSSEFQCVPLVAQCALHCKTKPDCISFNVKETIGQCEFYNYMPALCCNVPDCIHFRDRERSCLNPGCGLGERVVNFTVGGVEVPLLYFNNSIVIMQRLQGNLNFNRSFEDYKNGFGDVAGCDFWIGNEMMYRLTNQMGISFQLHVEVQTHTARQWFYANYSTFRIDPEQNGYMLHVAGYSGSAGDSLIYVGGDSASVHNGQMFSTPDKDCDRAPYSCAAKYASGWWYNYCWYSCLTGPYTVRSFSWYSLNDMGVEYYGTLRAARMTIRPNVTLRIS